MLAHEHIKAEMTEYKKRIGLRVRERREALGLSQDELAKRLGKKNRSTICQIESGEKSIPSKQLDKYAQVLYTTPQWLAGWDDDPDFIAGQKAAEIMLDDSLMQFVDKYKQLNNSNQAAVRTMVDALLVQQNANKT